VSVWIPRVVDNAEDIRIDERRVDLWSPCKMGEVRQSLDGVVHLLKHKVLAAPVDIGCSDCEVVECADDRSTVLFQLSVGL